MHKLHTGFDYNIFSNINLYLAPGRKLTNRVLLWGKKKFDFSRSKSSSGPISLLDMGFQFQCNTSGTDILHRQ